MKSSGLGNKASGASFISTNTAGGTKPTVYVNNAAGTGLLAETAAGWAIMGKVTSGFGNAVSGYTTSSDPGSWGGNFTAQTGTAVYASTNSNVGGALAPVGVYGESTGTGSVGGAFWIQNATNDYPALYANTIGTGPAFRGETASGSAVMEATHKGTNGSAGSFEITNPTNTSSGVYSETIGSGPAVFGKNTGAGNGFGGLFEVESATNTYPAIQAKSKGTGSAIRAIQQPGDGPGPGMDVLMLNPASTATGLIVEQQGLGEGARFNINQATSSNAAIRATTNGTGSALALYQSNNGIALEVAQGGLRFSSIQNVTTSGAFPRATLYNVTAPTSSVVTLTFASVDGDVVYVSSQNNITFDGVSITGSSTIVRQLVKIGGTWKFVQ